MNGISVKICHCAFGNDWFPHAVNYYGNFASGEIVNDVRLADIVCNSDKGEAKTS